MIEDLLRKRSVVPIGSREWLERLRAGQEPDWRKVLPPSRQKVRGEPTVPDNVRQHLRAAGRRGGHERARNYALRSVRESARFWKRYGYTPDKVTARPVAANAEVREQLRTLASRGGQARARKFRRHTESNRSFVPLPKCQDLASAAERCRVARVAGNAGLRCQH
jgi:hypothetical protein